MWTRKGRARKGDEVSSKKMAHKVRKVRKGNNVSSNKMIRKVRKERKGNIDMPNNSNFI